MADRPLPSLAVPWVLLWLLVSFLEMAVYLHDPNRPWWQAAIVLGASAVSALLVVAVWAKSQAGRKLLWAPAYVAGMLALHYGLRTGLFALAGAHYDFTPTDSHPIFEGLKYAAFYALLAFGSKTLLEPPIAEPAAGRPGLARLQVPVGDKVRLIEAKSIDWVEADDNYVRIHTGGQDYAMRSTLRQVLADLGGDSFVRIHKSAAVNVAEIDTLQPLAKGDAELVLRSGVKLRVSRRFRQDLQSRIGA
jgi:DNA-binding LytR/AlgR family response regulator